MSLERSIIAIIVTHSLPFAHSSFVGIIDAIKPIITVQA